jgi:hypothetical protein
VIFENETLNRPARAIASGERPPWEDLSDSDDESEHDNRQEPEQASELDQIGSYIRETIRCFLRLSMTIQNPAPHDRYMKGMSVDTSYFQPFDTQHVRSKFPNAKEFVGQRLGKSITTRRQFLKYSENHRKRLKSGLMGEIDEDAQSTIASSLPLHIKTGAFGLPINENDDLISQTSLATTVANSDKLTAPPFPKNAIYGQEFECPLCYCIVSIDNWDGWK